MSVTAAVTVEVQLTPGVWTAIDPDLSGVNALTAKRGMSGNGPLDLVAATGECQFTLRNDARNSALVQGYYSPSHADRRAGWTFGIPIRVSLTSGAASAVVFRGKVRVIAPEPGRYRTQRALVTAYDAIRDLAESDLREVDVQVNKTETELLAALLAALSADAQPPSTDLDSGIDSFPYAFDDLAGGTKALPVARDVVVSAFGLLFVAAAGTLTYRTRHAIGTTAVAYDLVDDDLDDLDVPSSLDGVVNRVRATIHPRTISAAATEVLYDLPSGTTIEIPAGETREVWTDYSDPDDRTARVGGIGIDPDVEGGTHFSANSAADGTGADLTSAIAATLDPFSSTAKWTLANTGTQAAHVRTLKVIGQAVRDPGPQTFESYDPSVSGQPMDVDLPYQDDQSIGQSAADFLRAQYGPLTKQVASVSFIASKSTALMAQALQREIGDRITVTETVTGLDEVECVIRSVELEVRAGGWVLCRWGLRPASPFAMWQLGIAGSSELGVTTVLGF